MQVWDAAVAVGIDRYLVIDGFLQLGRVMRGELVPEISRAFVYFLYAGVQSRCSLRVQASLAVCDLIDLGAYDLGGVLRCQRFALCCDAHGCVPYTFEAVLLGNAQRALDIVFD